MRCLRCSTEFFECNFLNFDRFLGFARALLSHCVHLIPHARTYSVRALQYLLFGCGLFSWDFCGMSRRVLNTAPKRIPCTRKSLELAFRTTRSLAYSRFFCFSKSFVEFLELASPWHLLVAHARYAYQQTREFIVWLLAARFLRVAQRSLLVARAPASPVPQSRCDPIQNDVICVLV